MTPSRQKGISVVVPFYNDSATLPRALDSVAKQTVKVDELFIVDDASAATESAALQEIVRSFSELTIRVLTRPTNGGPSAARNLGWDHTRSTHLAWLDADDSWAPTKLQEQVALMRSSPHLGLVGTLGTFGNSAARTSSSTNAPIAITARQQLLRNRFVTSSVMLRADIALRFNTELRYSEDNDLWCRILLSGSAGSVIPKPYTVYHKPLLSPEGPSGKYGRMFRGQLIAYRGLRRDGLISRGWLISAYASATVRFIRRMTLVLKSVLQRKLGRRN